MSCRPFFTYQSRCYSTPPVRRLRLRLLLSVLLSYTPSSGAFVSTGYGPSSRFRAPLIFFFHGRQLSFCRIFEFFANNKYFFLALRATFLFHFEQQFNFTFHAAQDFPLFLTHERASTTLFYFRSAQQFYSAQCNNNSIFAFFLLRLRSTFNNFILLSLRAKFYSPRCNYNLIFDSALASTPRNVQQHQLCINFIYIPMSLYKLNYAVKVCWIFLLILLCNRCLFSGNMLTSVCAVLATC